MPTIRCICLSLALLSLTSLASQLPAASSTNELVVFTAKKIITMEPAMPEATAVAVSKVVLSRSAALSRWPVGAMQRARVSTGALPTK